MSIAQYAASAGPEISNQACALARLLSVAELAALVGARPVGGSLSDAIIGRVCIDSRAAAPQSVFVALAGARSDGHRYLPQVAAAGCVAALVSQAWADAEPGAARALAEAGCLPLAVADPLAALQDWAAAYLTTLAGLVRVGVTGSNGKTTTKEMLAAVLSTRYRVMVSPGNLNSVIGLPLAALAVQPGTEVAVFEMAMSERGEMARLADIVRPTLAVVTNVGTAHIGNIGSQHQIALEKKRVFDRIGADGIAFIPGNDAFAAVLADGVAGSVRRFGAGHSLGYEGSRDTSTGQAIRWNGRDFALAAGGEHLRDDALAAIAVGEALGVAADDIRRGLESWRPAHGRNELVEGRVSLLLDCYNANPDSMAASLRAFGARDAGGRRKVAVLGDMFELGAHAPEAHAAIGRLASGLGFDLTLFCGAAMEQAWLAWQAAGAAGEAVWFADFAALAEAAGRLVREGDAVLLKASRGMELERLAPVLLGTAGPANHTQDKG